MRIGIIYLILNAGFASILSGCVSVSAEDKGNSTQTPPSLQGSCNADKAKNYIGQQATVELGGELLAVTGASTLRWAPPDSALTADYSPARLTVSYDNNMAITKISCG